ncbi:MAG: hypothetical protein ACJ79H_10355 [Myxococcales bacterium]
MVAAAVLILAAALDATAERQRGDSVQSLLREESPDVFLAKATLQQYLSRIVRRDWDGVKRLTHPKARLWPWSQRNDELKTFEFKEARSAGPGTVVIELAEDVYHRDAQEMSTGDPAVYLLFKSRGAWLVGDRKAGAHLANLSNDSIRSNYPGWVDHQALAQARRSDRLTGKHR